MAQLSARKLTTLLTAPPESAVFFLHGDEDHLRDQAAGEIVRACLDPATKDFNFDQLRGSEAGAEEIASMAATPPMMASHRVIVLRDAQGLSPKAREVVESIAASPPPGLIFVIVAQIPSGSRAKFYTTLQQRALSVEFPAVSPLDLPGWLIDRAMQEHERDLDLDAARGLVGAVGGQLGILAGELEKLVAYAGERKRITLDDVTAVSGYIPRSDRWKWFDLVTDKRFGEALSDLPDLLAAGENGVGLVIGISSQVMRLGLAIAGGQEVLEREMKGFQRKLAGRISSSARFWTAEEVEIAVEELLRADRLLKSASMTDRQAIEELLLRLAGRLSPRRNAA